MACCRMAMVMTGRVVLNIRACDAASRHAPESASALEMPVVARTGSKEADV